MTSCRAESARYIPFGPSWVPWRLSFAVPGILLITFSNQRFDDELYFYCFILKMSPSGLHLEFIFRFDSPHRRFRVFAPASKSVQRQSFKNIVRLEIEFYGLYPAHGTVAIVVKGY